MGDCNQNDKQRFQLKMAFKYENYTDLSSRRCYTTSRCVISSLMARLQERVSSELNAEMNQPPNGTNSNLEAIFKQVLSSLTFLQFNHDRIYPACIRSILTITDILTSRHITHASHVIKRDRPSI